METESLNKEGMPFHNKKIISDILNKIKMSALGESIKQILTFDLNNKKTAGYMDSYSLSDYAEIIKVLVTGVINKEDFRNFSLFYDYDIFLMSDKNLINKRIADNNNQYKKINDSIRFGDPERDLSHEFSDDLIDKVKNNASKKEHWDEEITFADVEKSIKKKNKDELPLEIEKIKITADDLILSECKDYYVKAESDKGVKYNRKHILIFNKNNSSEFEIEISLSDYPKKNELRIIDKKMNTEASVIGKKLIIKHSHNGISINRVDFNCTERMKKFKFSFCIINCSSFWFKDISTLYLIEAVSKKKQSKSLIINCSSEEIKFNGDSDLCETECLKDGASFVYNENKSYKLFVNENSFNDENIAYAKLQIGENVLDIVFKEETPSNVSCSGIRIEQKKLYAKRSFLYKGNNKLSLGTSDYNTKDELRENLELEEYIVKTKFLSFTIYGNERKEEILEIRDDIKNAYYTLIDYFNANDTLPSLAYYDDELSKLAVHYIKTVFTALSEIEDNKPLSKSQQDILRIGVINYPEKELVAYSPLHPLNVAYQVMLTRESSDMKQEIRDDILKKFCSDNLMPMIRNEKGKLCKVFEQKHSPQWTYYYPSDIKKINGSRSFVPIIVKEKIQEFYNHFRYLFINDNIGSNKLIINAVNMGDCNNLFRGIINYYKEKLNKRCAIENMLKITVNIYNDNNMYNVFECLSCKSLLKRFIGIKEEDCKFSENELINCLISNLKYYQKDKNADKYEYCHLSFVEMDQKTEEGFSNHTDIRSGNYA